MNLIAAVSRNGVIGLAGALPWNLPEDLKRFKETTYGAPVIMGRKTYESIGRLLPGRKNVIITRDATRIVPGAWIARSLEEALRIAEGAADVFVIGGGEVYRLGLPLAQRIYLTEVDVHIDGDAFFPGWPALGRGPLEMDGNRLHFREVSRESKPANPEKDRPAYDFLVFEKA